MQARTLKKLLLSLIAIGALASITTGGTYAIMNSEAENASGAIASATLTMSNNVNATLCLSQNGTNNSVSSGCGALVSSSTLQYPGTLVKVNVTLTNTGSAPGYDLGVSMPGATAGAGCTESNSPGATIHNGGHPCGSTGDLFYIQETQSNFTTPVHCWYPSSAGTTCAITSGGTLNNFAANYYYNGPNLGPKLDLGNDTTASPNTQYALPPTANQTASSRYFVIGIQEGTDNTLQGVMASFNLLWHLDSAP